MCVLFYIYRLSLAVLLVGGVTVRSLYYTCACVCTRILAYYQWRAGLFGDEVTASRNGVPQAINFNYSSRYRACLFYSGREQNSILPKCWRGAGIKPTEWDRLEATYRTFRLWRPWRAWPEIYLSWFPEIRLGQKHRDQTGGKKL